MLPPVDLTPGELPPRVPMQDSATVWSSLGPTNADTPPPEEVNEEFFHASQLEPLEPVSPTEPPLVAVIGVGYVGLHLVTVFGAKYNVLAYDVSKARLASLAADLAPYPSITLTSTPAHLAAATHFLVAVPTTLLPDRQIDTSYVRAALTTIGTYARPGSTIVIESSVGVGMTRKLLSNLMRSRNLKAGMSPERVDPGRTNPPLSTIPKLISGLTPASLTSIRTLYTPVFTHVVPVSSPEVAEMAKLYENCQRMVCIAYANEMADACAALHIDAFEVADAAATKPFGFAPYAPSWGVGGHCIPVNPYYLLSSCEMPLLGMAAERMGGRPGRVADGVVRGVVERVGGGRRARVLVVGVGFKAGQSVLSCSPGVAVVERLVRKWGVEVEWVDPLVRREDVVEGARRFDERGWCVEGLRGFDLIVVGVRQHGLDWGVLEELGPGVEVKWCCA